MTRTSAKIHKRVFPKISSLNRSLMGHKMRISNNTELLNIRISSEIEGESGSESGNCLKELSSSSTCHQWLKYNPSAFKFHLKVDFFFLIRKILLPILTHRWHILTSIFGIIKNLLLSSSVYWKKSTRDWINIGKILSLSNPERRHRFY